MPATWKRKRFVPSNATSRRDYRKVMTEFGTMVDFNELLKGVKQRDMKMILDLVVNHTSDEHAWFVQSRQSKDDPCSDYYIWRPAKDGKEPSNWISFFAGSAWKNDASRVNIIFTSLPKGSPIAICARFNEGLDAHSWPTVYLTNHDNPRSVSHFGDDSPKYRILSAKLLATFQLTSKGTPFIYQGDA